MIIQCIIIFKMYKFSLYHVGLRQFINFFLKFVILFVILFPQLFYCIHSSLYDFFPELIRMNDSLSNSKTKNFILRFKFQILNTGLAVLDAKSCGKISSYAMIYYMTTTMLASITGKKIVFKDNILNF